MAQYQFQVSVQPQYLAEQPPPFPALFGRFVQAEIPLWAKVVKFSGAKPE
jgi:hypothetical protein